MITGLRNKLLNSLGAPLMATLLNLLMVYIVYMIARVAYLLENWTYFSSSFSWEVVQGGLVFDTAAILVTNIPYIVMMLFLFTGRRTKGGIGRVNGSLSSSTVWHWQSTWPMLSISLSHSDAPRQQYSMNSRTNRISGQYSSRR